MFAAGRLEHIALQRLYIHRHLADGLARVDEVGNGMPPGHIADGLGRVDQATVGREPGEVDQLHLCIQHRLQRHRAGRAAGIARDDLHPRPGLNGQFHARQVTAPFVAPH